MLDRLGGRDQAGVDGVGGAELLDRLFALGDDAVDRLAGLGLRLLTENLKHLLQPGHMLLGLHLMRVEGILQAVALAASAIFGKVL